MKMWFALPRPIIALLLAAGLVATACNGQPDVVDEAPPEPDEAPVERVFTVEDLQGIIPDPGDTPDDMAHLESLESEEAVSRVAQDVPEAEGAIREGFLGARSTTFASDQLLPAVGFWGAVYEDPAAAGAAMSALVGAVAGSLDEVEPAAIPLGEEGASMRGVAPDVPEGFEVEESHYVWRVSNLLLWVVAAGLDEAEVRSHAEAMDARTR